MDTTYHMPSAASPKLLMLPPPLPTHFETQRYTKQEWEVHRSMIEEHCKNVKYTDLLGLLREKSFYVSEKQLKDRLKTWSHGKNVRASEMKAIVRKQAQRRAEGKASRIRVRGKLVPDSTITRWQKRHEPEMSTDHWETLSSASTPSNISCGTATPVASPSPSFSMLDRLQTFGNVEMPGINSARSPMSPPNYFQQRRDRSKQLADDTYVVSDLFQFLKDYDETFDGYSPVFLTIPAVVDNSKLPLDSVPAQRSLDLYPTTHYTHYLEGASDPFTASGTAYAVDTENFFFISRQQESSTQSVVQNLVGQKQCLTVDEQGLIEHLRTSQIKYGSTHPMTLAIAEELVRVSRRHYRFNIAEPLCKQVVRNWFIFAGENHNATLAAFVLLSGVLRYQNRTRLAESLSRHVHYKLQLAQLPGDSAQLTIKNELASCCVGLGLDKEAEELFRQAIRIGSSTLPPDNHNLIFAMLEISSLLMRRDENAEAEKMIRTILQSLDLSRATSSIQILVAQTRLVELLIKRNDPEVETTLRAHLQRYAKVIGPEHVETLLMQEMLSVQLCDTGRYEEGISLFKDAIKKATSSTGENGLRTLAIQLNLANALIRQKKFSQAETLVEKVSSLALKTFGLQHENSQHASWLLAKCYQGQGKLEEAAEILKKALENMKETKTPGYWLVTRCAYTLEELRRDMQLRDVSMLHGDDMS